MARTPRYEVIVKPFPNVNDGRWQISDGGGVSVVWGHDGRELFFAGEGMMTAVPFETEPTFVPGNHEPLFPMSYYQAGGGGNRSWDLARDGRFLMVKYVEDVESGGENTSGPHFVVVRNWDQELERLVPAN